MPFRFTKQEIEKDTIVQSREFDNALGNFVDVINGRMDRDNLPEGCLDISKVPNGTFASIKVFSNLNANDSDIKIDQNYDPADPTVNPDGINIAGFRYGEFPTYAGDIWIEATNQNVLTEEGMLEISWHCSELKTQYWSYWKDHGTDKVALKRMAWQIRVDGAIIYQSGYQYGGTETSIHRCNIPISKGYHDISIHWKTSAQRDDDDQKQVVANWFGGQLVTINRYR